MCNEMMRLGTIDKYHTNYIIHNKDNKLLYFNTYVYENTLSMDII